MKRRRMTGQQPEASNLDAATRLRRCFGGQVEANLEELGYGG